MLGDPLIGSKLEFFASVAKDIEPFLRKYQSDRPMIPFLAMDLINLVTDLMKRIVKEDIMAKNKGALHLLKLGDKEKDSLKDPSKVDIGYQASRSSLTKKASDKQRYSFRVECRDFIQATLLKILEKTPLNSVLVRSLGWLNPTMMAGNDESKRETLLLTSLDILTDAKRINPVACDMMKKEYRKFCADILSSKHIDVFRNFNSELEDHRLDELLAEHMKPKYPALWDVVQQLLLLSHGQATVERGFSVHKQTTVENLSKEGLTARRIVIQAVRHAGGAENITVGKEMLSFASSARAQYQTYLDAKKKEAELEQASQKRKAEDEELAGLKSKRQRLINDSRSLQASADRLAVEAAEQKKMSLLLESNAIRKRAKELEAEAQNVEQMISEMKG